VVHAWKVYRCWPSEYQAIPELDANGSDIAIESLVLQNEGWERDKSVTEPTET
jgi:phage tail-like protein